jgi:two-component SAPR family response regulator
MLQEKNIFSFEEKDLDISLQKSKELFLWIAIQGASSRTEIINALWLKDTIQNREYFKIALRKLRGDLYESPEIQSNPLIFESGLYNLHSSIEVQWDFKLLQQKFWNKDYIITDLEATANLPTNFLQGFTSEWIQNFKQGVIDSMYSTLLEVAATSSALRAIELLETAIAVDPLSEEAYKKLAAALKQSGRAEEAARVQQRFVAALES